MTELIIDRNIWLRGEGDTCSFLLRDRDRKMCCVGIYLDKLCHVPHRDLLDVTSADDVDTHDGVELPDWLYKIDGYSDICRLYKTNDDKFLAPEIREERITALFAQHGVTVTFIN